MNRIAAIVGKPSFDDLTFNIGDGVIRYGSFLTALVTFLIIAFVLFLIVQALPKVMPAKTVTRECPHCLSEIPTGAGTCAFCGKDSPAAAPAEDLASCAGCQQVVDELTVGTADSLPGGVAPMQG